MRQETINIYSFNELSEDAKQKAIESLYDLNVDYDWWNFTYDDAAAIGLEISEFDLGRRRHIAGELTISACESAELTLKLHGETCDTYQTAVNFLNEWKELVKKYSDGVSVTEVAEDNEYEFDQEADDLEEEYRKNILQDYFSMLRNKYEYLTSEESIIESIRANEYEFTEDGELY